MEGKCNLVKILWRSLTYLLVAVLASAVTLALYVPKDTKLTELQQLVDAVFVGEYDQKKMEDAAAGAMIYALGDQWSYYLTAEEYTAYRENANNVYVGIGVTIALQDNETGFNILEVAPGGSAQEAGVLPGDLLIRVNGQDVTKLNVADTKALIGNKEGTEVTLTVLRDGEEKSFSMTCRTIQLTVATGKLLEGNIGLVRINNFNSGCAEQTIDVIEQLQQQGAKSLIFDVRNNPGGYVAEMIEVLDYLLPEGVLIREEDNKGKESVEYSDAACLDIPMAVLMNGDSYSASEFFAACLREYDRATTVGTKTFGKGYYQNTFTLSDGSAVNISTGKYFTPKGVSLAETGGLIPDIPVEVDEKTAALIYGQVIEPADDPQLQAAVAALQKTAG